MGTKKNKYKKILRLTSAALILLVVVFLFLLQSPFVQRNIVNFYVQKYAKEMGVDLSFGSVYLNIFLFTAQIEGLYLSDTAKKEFIRIGKLDVALEPTKLSPLRLKKVFLQDANFYLHKDKESEKSNIRFLSDFFSRLKKEESKSFKLQIDQVDLRNLAFRYIDENKAWEAEKMDFDHIDLQKIYLKGTDFTITKDTVIGNIAQFSLEEQSGFRLLNFSAQALVSKGSIQTKYLKIKMPQSNLDMDLSFICNSWADYKDFIHKVRIRSDIRASVFNLSDIAYFAPSLKSMDNTLRMSMFVDGTIAKFKAKKMLVSTGVATLISSSISMKGLPKIKETDIELSIDFIKSNPKDVSNFILPNGKRILLPEKLNILQDCRIKGVYSGRFSEFMTKLDVKTNLGNILLAFDFKKQKGWMQGKGSVKGNGVEVARLLKAEKWLGSTDFNFVFNAEGKSADSLQYSLDGNLKNIHVKDFSIDQIYVHCDARKNYFLGLCKIEDELLKADFDGLIDFESSTPILRYKLDVDQFVLSTLIDSKDSIPIVLSTEVKADYQGARIDNIFGDFQITHMEIAKGDKNFLMDKMKISTIKQDSLRKKTQIRSDCFDLDLEGIFYFAEVPKIFKKVIDKHIPSVRDSLYIGDTHFIEDKYFQDFSMRAELKGLNPLFDIFVPGLSLSKDAALNLTYDSKEGGNISAQFNSTSIQFKSIEYFVNQFDMKTQGSQLIISTQANSLYLGDSVELPDFLINAHFLALDSVGWQLAWNNGKKSKNKNAADIRGILDFTEAHTLLLKIRSSDLFFAGEQWQPYEGAYILMREKYAFFHDFGLKSNVKGNAISLNGEISNQPSSSFALNFSNFDITYFDFLYSVIGMDLDAVIDGEIRFSDIKENFTMLSSVSLKDLSINQKKYGEAKLFSSFNKNMKGIYALFTIADPDNLLLKPKLKAEGYYYPRRKTDILDFWIDIKNLPLDFTKNYLQSFASDVSGNISGGIALGSKGKKPYFKGNLEADSIRMKVDILNCAYTIPKSYIEISSSGLYFKESDLYDDSYGTSASLRGGLKYDNFKNIALDFTIKGDNFLALNTQMGDDDLYAGTIFATADVKISGQTDGIEIIVNATTEKDSEAYFNLAGQSDMTESNFVVYRDFKNLSPLKNALSLEEKIPMRRKNLVKEKADSKLKFVLNANVTPDLSVNLDMVSDRMSANLRTKGSGNLRMEIVSGKAPALFGNYTLSDGSFDFSMQDLVNKVFTIRSGGNIAWTGDIGDARLDVEAVYPIKTSLHPVISSVTTAVGSISENDLKRKVNVESIIQLKDQLLNPAIHFDIALKNVDPEVEKIFFSVVNKENESEMLKQTFSLLMLNSFMASGDNSLIPSIANGAIVSSTELIFNQFNSVFSGISKDFNFGMNFVPENTTNNSEFQVMMSGQLFDDRLQIDGNVGFGGSSRDLPAQSASNVVGDINVEWKFTEQLRLRVFNRSNEVDMLKLESPYTQGVGVVFRRDFNDLGDFFRSSVIENSRKKKKRR